AELTATWLEERILALAIVHPDLIGQLLPEVKDLKWASGLAKTVYEELANCYTAGEVFDVNNLLVRLSDNIKTSLLELMLVVEQSYPDADAKKVEEELSFYLHILQSRSYAARRQELAAAIAAAESAHDAVQLKDLLEELSKL
ncbi:MAG: hypothetical protein V1826_01785, partial [bacterium]